MFQPPNVFFKDGPANVFITEGSRRIPCFLVRGSRSGAKRLVIYSHGNAEDLTSCQDAVLRLSVELETDVIAYEYPGYGPHPEESPSVRATDEAMDGVWEFAMKEGYMPSDVFLIGYSLGSGPSAACASRLARKGVSIGGLALISAYRSIHGVAVDNLPFLKALQALFAGTWDNERALRTVACSVIICHGRGDAVIPLHHAYALKQVCPLAELRVLDRLGHIGYLNSAIPRLIQGWMASGRGDGGSRDQP